MGCPRCKKNWLKVEGNKLICSCGFMEEVKPTYAQLLQRVGELESFISDYLSGCASEQDYIRWAIKLSEHRYAPAEKPHNQNLGG